MTSLPGMTKNNMAAKEILLVFKVEHFFFGKQTVKLKTDFTKVSRIGLLFRF